MHPRIYQNCEPELLPCFFQKWAKGKHHGNNMQKDKGVNKSSCGSMNIMQTQQYGNINIF